MWPYRAEQILFRSYMDKWLKIYMNLRYTYVLIISKTNPIRSSSPETKCKIRIRSNQGDNDWYVFERIRKHYQCDCFFLTSSLENLKSSASQNKFRVFSIELDRRGRVEVSRSQQSSCAWRSYYITPISVVFSSDVIASKNILFIAKMPSLLLSVTR